MSKCVLIVLFTFLIHSSLYAQQTFVEGIIKYAVQVKNPAEDKEYKPAGFYTIYVKGNLVRRELKMNKGYENIILINSSAKTAYSLQTSSTNNFAVQLDFNKFSARQQSFENFVLQQENTSIKILNYEAKKASIKYKDGSNAVIYYTSEIKLDEPNVLEHFPGINVLPLSFEFNREDGSTMRFEAEVLEIKPVATSMFTIPVGYKIISHKEYKEMSK